METVCTSTDFDVRNPYTGKIMKVFLVVLPNGKVMFHAPDEYHPGVPFDSPARALAMWRRRNGVECEDANIPVHCLHTGARLSPAVRDGKHFFTGAWNPTLLQTRETFLYYATMQNGSSDRPAPGKRQRVEAVVRTEMSAKRKARGGETQISDDALEAAEKSVMPNKDLLNLSEGSVSMHVSKKKAKK